MIGFSQHIYPSLFTFIIFSNTTTFSHIYKFLILSYKNFLYTHFFQTTTTTKLIILDKNTSLKNITRAGDYDTTNEMIMWKSNTYEHPVLIVAVYLLAMIVLVAFAGHNDGHYFVVFAFKTVVGVSLGEAGDSISPTIKSPHTVDICGTSANSEKSLGKVLKSIKKLMCKIFLFDLHSLT